MYLQIDYTLMYSALAATTLRPMQQRPHSHRNLQKRINKLVSDSCVKCKNVMLLVCMFRSVISAMQFDFVHSLCFADVVFTIMCVIAESASSFDE